MHTDEGQQRALKIRAIFKIWKSTEVFIFTSWIDNILRANCYPLFLCLQVPETQGEEQIIWQKKSFSFKEKLKDPCN